LVTTFASSVHRVNMILELAQKHNRVVAVVGRSMLNVIAHARNLGYIKCPDDLFVSLNQAKKLPPEGVLVLTTGSQGEPMAALTRIANKSHRQIRIQEGDTVVFSANPIPGNTIAVVNTIDKLMMQGAKVVYGKGEGLHVSGHGAQEDQKLMLAMTRPKFFLPVHGEHRMLIKHSQTAQKMGVPAENMVIIDNGDIVELTPDQIKIAGRVSSGIELVDSSRTGMVQDRVLKERQQLAEEGMVTIATAIGWDGRMVTKPEILVRGVALAVEPDRLHQDIESSIRKTLRDRWSDLSHTYNDDIEVDWVKLKTHLESDVQRVLKRELKSRPLLTLMIQTPTKPADMKSSRRRSVVAS